MAAPLLLAGLSLLPKIPEMWKSVSGLFGKKSPETVTEATNIASDIITSLKKGQISSSDQVELEKIMSSHKEKMADIALQEKQLELDRSKLDYEDLSDIRDLEKQAYKSEDIYVSRTRPMILRKLFYITIIYAFLVTLFVMVGPAIHISAATITAALPLIKWIGGFLFSSFGTAYLGYAGARSLDKRNPEIKNGNGLLAKAINTIVSR